MLMKNLKKYTLQLFKKREQTIRYKLQDNLILELYK